MNVSKVTEYEDYITYIISHILFHKIRGSRYMMKIFFKGKA